MAGYRVKSEYRCSGEAKKKAEKIEDFGQKRKTVAGENKTADKNRLQHRRQEIKVRFCLKDVIKSAILRIEIVSESLNDPFFNQF